MIAVFCGHAEVDSKNEIRAWLFEVTQQLLEEGIDIFYFGGYGEFDRMALDVVTEQKKQYSHINRILVLAYLRKNMNAAKQYDETVYPDLESVPPRYAIVRRNQKMIEAADVVVAYLTHEWGGAYQMIQYARRKRKNIIFYPEKSALS